MMKLFVLIFGISIFGCSQNVVSYSKYQQSAAYKISKEHVFFNQWIAIPQKRDKTKFLNKKLGKQYYECKKYHAKDSYAGIVSPIKFRILPYSGKDSAKFVEIVSKIDKNIHGLPKKDTFTYYMSLELDDSIGEIDSSSKLIFFNKEDDKFYLDRFCIFSVQ